MKTSKIIGLLASLLSLVSIGNVTADTNKQELKESVLKISKNKFKPKMNEKKPCAYIKDWSEDKKTKNAAYLKCLDLLNKNTKKG